MRTAFMVISTLALAVCLVSGVSAGLSGQKICIDPGHGGSDPGAVGNGLEEKTINLDIGLRFKDLLALDGATPIMTRTSDVYVTLQGRCDIANNNGANRFESIHNNAFSTSTPNGTETYCSPSGATESFDLRNKVNPEIIAHLDTYNRGVKTATFYVLENTNMPAILSESAFITNSEDAAKLANAAMRQEIAWAHLHGTQSHYGETPHDPGPDTDPPVISNVASSPGPGRVTITWDTNEAATSQVEYGLTTSYGSLTPLDEDLVTSHSVYITGLARKTTYHYRVRSKDSSGNEGISGDYTFKTK